MGIIGAFFRSTVGRLVYEWLLAIGCACFVGFNYGLVFRVGELIMQRTMTAVQDTILKFSTKPASDLPDNAKAAFPMGTVCPLSKVEPAADKHLRVWLGKDASGEQIWVAGRQSWYVFGPHVTITPPLKPTRISKSGFDFIASFEGLRLEAYFCSAGVLSIGYGSTGPHVYEGMRISVEQAENLFRNDLKRFEKAVSSAVKVPLTQAQFDALVSLTFNIGAGAFLNSTLLGFLNQGKYKDAADQFIVWNKANDKVLPGLTRRREAEREMFLRG